MKTLFIFMLCLSLCYETLGFGSKCKTPRHNMLLETFEQYMASFSENINKDRAAHKITWRRPGKVPKHLKVAIYGDLGLKKKTKRVLQMLREWGVQGIIISGDFDYKDHPKKFESMLDEFIPSDVPIFGAIGNHDIIDWDTKNGYQNFFLERLRKIGILRQCIGDFGVNSICGWNGLNILLSGVGTRGSAHVDFIEDTLALSVSAWKICVWHKCQTLFQAGKKKNQTGYGVYDMCRRFGGIVATSHVHQYSRTKLIKHYKKHLYENQTSHIDLNVKQSINIVSGLGGYSIDKYYGNLKENPWWAATIAREVKAAPGATLCTFHIEGDPEKAYCEFRDINGKIWDSWTIKSHIKLQPRPTRIVGNSVPTSASQDNFDSKSKFTKQHLFNQMHDNLNINFDFVNQLSAEDRAGFNKDKMLKNRIEDDNDNDNDDDDNYYNDDIGYENDKKIKRSQDIMEFTPDENADVTFGTMETGFQKRCNLNYAPILPSQNSAKSKDTPFLGLQFTNIKIDPKNHKGNLVFAEANLQILGARGKHIKIAEMETSSGIIRGDGTTTEESKIKSDEHEHEHEHEHDDEGDEDDGFVDKYTKTQTRIPKKTRSAVFEIRVIHNKLSKKLCKYNGQNESGGFDFIELLDTEPTLWKIENLDSEEVIVSENFADKINKIFSSKTWESGDTINIFINPTANSMVNPNKPMFIYGNGVNHGCFAPSLVLQK